MGNITRPLKTGGHGNRTYVDNFASGETTILDSEVDADIQAIIDQVNGTIEAVNLATDAVETAKIKDLSVTTAKLANDAVTAAKLLDKTAVVAAFNSAQSLTSLVIGNTETDITNTVSVAATGGYVIIGGTVSMSVRSQITSSTHVWTLRVYRDAVKISEVTGEIEAQPNVGGHEVTIEVPLPCPFMIDDPGAGTFAYKITGETDHATELTIKTPTSAPGTLYVVALT